MKSKWVIIGVIVLLSALTILAFAMFVEAENHRRKLSVEHSLLESHYEEREEVHDKLNEKYEKLKSEHSDLRNAYLKALAYEMAFDMLSSEIKGENYDTEYEYYRIMAREQLSAEDMKMVIKYLGEILQDKKQTS